MIPLALASLAVSGIGMVGSAINRSKANGVLNKEISDNESDYKKDYYSDYTQRADTQAALGRMRGLMKDRADTRRGTAAVMGSTPEAVVAGQKADNEVLGNTISNIAGQGANYKDMIRNRYLQNRSLLRSRQAAAYEDNANQFAQVGTQALQLGASSLVPGNAATNDTEVKVKPGGVLPDYTASPDANGNYNA